MQRASLNGCPRRLQRLSGSDFGDERRKFAVEPTGFRIERVAFAIGGFVARASLRGHAPEAFDPPGEFVEIRGRSFADRRKTLLTSAQERGADISSLHG